MSDERTPRKFAPNSFQIRQQLVELRERPLMIVEHDLAILDLLADTVVLDLGPGQPS